MQSSKTQSVLLWVCRMRRRTCKPRIHFMGHFLLRSRSCAPLTSESATSAFLRELRRPSSARSVNLDITPSWRCLITSFFSFASLIASLFQRCKIKWKKRQRVIFIFHFSFQFFPLYNFLLHFLDTLSFLLQPKLSDKLNFLFVVRSSVEDESRRNAIRSTWGSLSRVHEHKVQIVFSIEASSGFSLRQRANKRLRSPKMETAWIQAQNVSFYFYIHT